MRNTCARNVKTRYLQVTTDKHGPYCWHLTRVRGAIPTPALEPISVATMRRMLSTALGLAALGRSYNLMEDEPNGRTKTSYHCIAHAVRDSTGPETSRNVESTR